MSNKVNFIQVKSSILRWWLLHLLLTWSYPFFYKMMFKVAGICSFISANLAWYKVCNHTLISTDFRIPASKSLEATDLFLSMFQQCEETEIYRIKSSKTIPRALRLKRHLIMALSFLGKEHRRKSKPKIQPRDSLTLIPNFMGLFKTSKKSTVSHIFSFSSAISSDIIAVSRPRIVLLNQLGKHVQKANPEPAEG